ncbi:Glycerophosphoryl diester phosphodiesterase [Enhygromyxa salina]|uniref:Glycerophosphoryl diester phosphodiesterase n=1 Tax=Enhygromyxa salina TaxID=215803 RepID=A0A2S9XDW7_9BACT|nr:GAP family protein [Enhygromyxa salina]PRP91054.1 Glycerophosphoryl diester phosphodiesterase [Enhygromyxa salina]
MKLALLQALVIAMGGLSALGSLLIVLLLLNSKAGVRASLAYVLGYSGSYLTMGLTTVWLGRSLVELDEASGPSPLASALFVAMGLLLWFLAAKKWLTPPDPDAPPPKLMEAVDTLTPVKAFGFGVVVTLLNVKNLAIYFSAISVIAATPMTPAEAGLCVVLTVVVFCAGLLCPLLIYALVPKRADAWLEKMRNWIEANTDKVARVILPLFATLFLIKGGRGLWLVYFAAAPSAEFDVQGHRGDRGKVPPGNTIPSYESALALGVDTLEADMQITRDGAVVMGHDDDLRVTGCAWAGSGDASSPLISEQLAAEVSSWDCHLELEGIQPPPPLAAALDLDREVALNLELKRPTEADADVYVQALLAYQATCGGCLDGRLTLQSFEWSALRHARDRYGEALAFRAAILDKQGDFEAIVHAREFAQIWSPKHELVTAELVERVQGLDMQVIPWTVNEEARMRELIELGVDGIITDYPDLLLRVLERDTDRSSP